MKDWALIHQLLRVIGYRNDECYDVRELRFKNYFKFFGRDERDFEVGYQSTFIQNKEKLDNWKAQMLPMVYEHLEYMQDDRLVKGNLNIDDLEASTIKLTSKGYDLLAIFEDKKLGDFIYKDLINAKRAVNVDLLFEIAKLKLKELF